jgi:hypothetical protein
VKVRQATPAKRAACQRHNFHPTTPHLDDALMGLVELNAAQACASCSADTVGAAQAALLQWVAVLFMIFQAPSIRSIVCRSTHPSDRSSALSNPRRTEAISPA